MGVDYLVVEDELYDQEGRRKLGKPPGIFNLIDRVREASDRWQVVSEPERRSSSRNASADPIVARVAPAYENAHSLQAVESLQPIKSLSSPACYPGLDMPSPDRRRRLR